MDRAVKVRSAAGPGVLTWREGGAGRRPVGTIGALGVWLGLLTGAATACSSSSPPPPPVGVVADSGFRPGPDGFTFQNYGAVLSDGTVPTNLTPADVETIFGPAVCADADIGKCDLIP